MDEACGHPVASLRGDELAEAVCEVARHARENGLTGFGGGCWAAAVALNRVVFGGQGSLVAGLNAPLMEGGVGAFGHAAVLFQDACWDMDGRPKEETDVEAWGMLDPEDSDYRDAAEEEGIAWGEEPAAEAGFWEFEGEPQFVEAVAGEDFAERLEEAEAVLRAAVAAWEAGRSAALRAP